MRYFNNVTFMQARSLILESFPAPLRAGAVPIAEVIGRVTAEPVCAAFDVPGEDRCLADGCAVRSIETAGGREGLPVRLPSAVPVETGAPVPEGCDAVVMVEDLDEADGYAVTSRAARPGQYIRRAGSEIRGGEQVLPAGHRVRPDEVGALVACGVGSVLVRALRVTLIPVGEGLVPPGTRPGAGEMVESNTARAAAFLAARGVDCVSRPSVSGGMLAIGDALLAAARDSDLVLVFGGASKGSSDSTAKAVRALGEVIFHGVSMQPGRPTLAGRVGPVPVIGLPGYPFAAGVVLRELVAPLLCSWRFPPPQQYPAVPVELARAVVSEVGVDEFVPLVLGFVGDRWVAYSRPRNPASHLADIGPHAFLHVPGGVEGYEAGTVHRVHLTATERTLERVLLVHGAPPGPTLDRLLTAARTAGMRVELLGGRAAAARDMLATRRCHIAAVEEARGRVRLLSASSLISDRRVSAMTVAAGVVGCPVEFVTVG